MDTSVFLWLRKQRPRFAQGQPKGYFQMKELDRTTEAIVPMNEMWKAECQHAPICAITCQHGPTLQFFSCAEKDSLCGTVVMAWINAMVFVPMAQAPPKAGAKELPYNSLSLIHEFRSLFSPKVIFAGLLRKAFSQKHCGHECFSVVAQATAKIRPRPAQGLFSNERT